MGLQREADVWRGGLSLPKLQIDSLDLPKKQPKPADFAGGTAVFTMRGVAPGRRSDAVI
jgi:hypothetical protein